MQRLLNIGFRSVGYWFLNQGVLDYQLQPEVNGDKLVCFTMLNQVYYIARARDLIYDLDMFRDPDIHQRRGIRVHNLLILEVFDTNLEIMVLDNKGLFYYGGFKLNLLSGLYSSLMEAYRPPWNVLNRRNVVLDNGIAENIVFRIPIIATYYTHGFIWMPAEHSHRFPEDLTEVLISFENFEHNGYVHRNSESDLVRIMVGKDLREYLSDVFTIDSSLGVRIVTPNYIELFE